MVVFDEVTVTDQRAAALLAEYFADRAATFPPGRGSYRVVFPDADAFVRPHGVFLLVLSHVDGDAFGCGGVRRIAAADGTRFEVKHLWVQPQARRSGAGRAILSELEQRARALGATEMVLDTNASLTAAGSLYASAGYRAIAPYNDNPNATNWYAKSL